MPLTAHQIPSPEFITWPPENVITYGTASCRVRWKSGSFVGVSPSTTTVMWGGGEAGEGGDSGEGALGGGGEGGGGEGGGGLGTKPGGNGGTPGGRGSEGGPGEGGGGEGITCGGGGEGGGGEGDGGGGEGGGGLGGWLSTLAVMCECFIATDDCTMHSSYVPAVSVTVTCKLASSCV